MRIIDPHVHLFDLALGDYDWLKASNAPTWPDKAIINQNFNEQSLQLTKPLQLAAFVHIEAGFDNHSPWRELQWLEQHCRLPFKAVACADITLASADFHRQIAQLQMQQSLVGIRHILDNDALALLSSSQVQQNLAYLGTNQLSFDCQMPLDNGPATEQLIKIIKKNPTLTVIINHTGFPPVDIKGSAFKVWQDNLKRLADHGNVAMKCSGWEMLTRHYDTDFVGEIIETCLNTFARSKLMLASNFPLTLLSQPYQNYWQMIERLLTQEHRQALCYDNAAQWYKLVLPATS